MYQIGCNVFWKKFEYAVAITSIKYVKVFEYDKRHITPSIINH